MAMSAQDWEWIVFVQPDFSINYLCQIIPGASMYDKTTAMIEVLRNNYHLRVQLSGGLSAKLIGPVHRIFLTTGKKETRYHLGDEDLQILVTNIAWEKLGVDFDSSDMQELKKRLKTLTAQPPVPYQK